MKCLSCNGRGHFRCVGDSPDDVWTVPCRDCLGTGHSDHRERFQRQVDAVCASMLKAEGRSK